jgi:DNA-binding MarR family transcriptional regulator
VQFVLLASLTWLDDDGPVTQKRLAEHAATDPMMTSQVVRALTARGLVARAAHPQDGRAVVVAVTADGAALANRAVVAVEACDEAFFAALGDGRDHFVEQLRRLLPAPPA